MGFENDTYVGNSISSTFLTLIKEIKNLFYITLELLLNELTRGTKQYNIPKFYLFLQ